MAVIWPASNAPQNLNFVAITNIMAPNWRGKEFRLPLVTGSEQEKAIDISRLRQETEALILPGEDEELRRYLAERRAAPIIAAVRHRASAIAREEVERTFNTFRLNMGMNIRFVDAADRFLDDCPKDQRGWEWFYLKRQVVPDIRELPVVARRCTGAWIAGRASVSSIVTGVSSGSTRGRQSTGMVRPPSSGAPSSNATRFSSTSVVGFISRV